MHALIRHHRAREPAILSRIEAGDGTIPAIAANVHEGLDPALANAAAASARAHIEALVERGLVATEGAMAPRAIYRPA
ncbi:MAG: hypothetical protein ACREDJ_03585 [Methylocella sp.]